MIDYLELQIKINPEIAEILSAICFENLECDGVVLAEETYKDDLVLVSTTEETLKVYLRSADNVPEILTSQREFLLEQGFTDEELGSWEFKIEEVENQDWCKKWKEHWDVTKVTDKITIVPSWIDYTPKEDEITIVLDPGTAFGTGTHPTTQLCMIATEKYMKQGDKMADIGMGSGILAVCASKLGAKSVYGCDNDELVVETAIENAAKNNVIAIFEHNTADRIEEKFDFVAANILHNVLADIMGDLKNIISDNGKMVLSGIIEEKKQVVLDAIKLHNLKLIDELQQDMWVGLVVEKCD